MLAPIPRRCRWGASRAGTRVGRARIRARPAARHVVGYRDGTEHQACFLVLVEDAFDARHPVVRHAAIVVGECDEGRARGADADVASDGKTACRASEKAKAPIDGERGERFLALLIVALIDDEELEGVSRVGQDRFDACADVRGPVARADDDRNAKGSRFGRHRTDSTGSGRIPSIDVTGCGGHCFASLLE